MLGGIDISILGVVLAVVTGFGSYILGRRMREKRQGKRRGLSRAAQANETRQVRRARERREQEGK